MTTFIRSMAVIALTAGLANCLTDVPAFATTPTATPSTTPTPFAATPLTDFATNQRYLGHYYGMLYNGSNTEPSSHGTAGAMFASMVRKLDTNGQPSPNGKIVVLALGMSNHTIEMCNGAESYDSAWPGCMPSSLFYDLRNDSSVDNQNVVFADCAAYGETANFWVDDSSLYCTPGHTCETGLYTRCDDILADAKDYRGNIPITINANQVQVVIWQDAEAGPFVSLASDGSTNCENVYHPTDADACGYVNYSGKMLRYVKGKYPNVKLVFIDSRIYSYGLQHNSPLNPEPYAYENGFAAKWLISYQINQEATGNSYSTSNPGDLRYSTGSAPWIDWLNYSWASGETARSDGLFFCDGQNDSICNPNGGTPEEDYAPDGTHQNVTGNAKIVSGAGSYTTGLLYQFENNPYVVPWLY